MPNCSGLVNRKDIISTQDAPVVANLRRAGCIVLGVTNTSELCMWYESANFVYGRTNNPYDVRRIVGGSSGTSLGVTNTSELCMWYESANFVYGGPIIPMMSGEL